MQWLVKVGAGTHPVLTHHHFTSKKAALAFIAAWRATEQRQPQVVALLHRGLSVGVPA